jgi:hypothetical protein
MTAFNYGSLFAYVYAWVYAHLFNMFACILWSALRVLGSKVLFFYISCGLGAALMHTELIITILMML